MRLTSENGPIDVFLMKDEQEQEKDAEKDKGKGRTTQMLTPSKQFGSLSLKTSPPASLPIPETPKRFNTVIEESPGSHVVENDPNLHTVNSFMSPVSSTLFLQPGSGQNSSDGFLTGYPSTSSQATVPFGAAFKMDDVGSSKQERAPFLFSGSHPGDSGSPPDSKAHLSHGLLDQETSPLFGKTKESSDYPMDPYDFGLTDHEGMSDLYDQDFGDPK